MSPSRAFRFRPWALALLVLVVFALHQDVWNWQRAEPFLFGLLPVGLAYHAGYTLLTAGLMALLVKYAWPRELETEEAPGTAGTAGTDSTDGTEGTKGKGSGPEPSA